MRRHVYAVWRTDADRRPSIRAAVEALRTAGERVGRRRRDALPGGAHGPARPAQASLISSLDTEIVRAGSGRVAGPLRTLPSVAEKALP